MSKKIVSIQWCRAIAINSVLAFHLWPELFSYGFLGVDVFFVISGYLMALILDRLLDENSFKDTIKIFYFRRFKRIFPNYFAILLYIFGFGFFIFHSADFEFLQDDAKWAAVFISNLKPIIEENDYFKMTTDFKLILHTWSLAVEIQFYLIAPIIFFIAKKSNNYELFFIISALASLLSYLHYRTSTIAFNLLFCRVWQFAIGTLIHHWHKKQKYIQLKDYQLYIMILLTMFLFLSYPMKAFAKDFPHFCRILVTLASSQLLIMDQASSNSIISKIFCYIGDASYSIYLIHWPIIVFYKYMDFTWNISLTIPIIIVLSFLQHHLFELPMQKFSVTLNFMVSAFLAITILALSFMPLHVKPTRLTIHQNITSLKDSIKYNEYLNAECKKYSVKCGRDDILNSYFPKIADSRFSTKCVINYTNNNNKMAVLAGNSFMAAHAGAVVQAIEESRHGWKFKKIYILSQAGCPSFDSINEPQVEKQFRCHLAHGVLKKFITELKPDLYITMNRMEFLKNAKIPLAENEGKDNLTKLLSKELKDYALLTKNIVILEPNFVVNATSNPASSLSLVHKLSKNQSLNNLYLKKQQIELPMRISWTRVKWAAKNCDNCHILEFQNLYCNQTICDLFDRKNNLAYFCDPWHFNKYGAAKIIPRLVEFLNKLLI